MFRSLHTIAAILTAIALSAAGCAGLYSSKPSDRDPAAPTALREFRAAWVATVANIDWPSRPGLSTNEQKAEALAILDTARVLNLNALIFQVRPQCDAFYPSPYEPWSLYLTGQQGEPPNPYYDPLDFWIQEAHNRGIELHVWFNPYRAHHPAGGDITEASIVRKRPDLVRKLDNGYYWLDPAEPGTQEHSFAVVMDVVRRYDIDGVHFDDYFYPYGDGSFADDRAWQAYRQSGGKLIRENWRRDQVNRFIRRVYRAIKKDKPQVKFGLSPFGIWRPNHPASIQGFDPYAVLYADARLWLNEGWIDYWTPQLYWPTSQIPQSYPVLLGWWVQENKKQRHLWPGLFTSRVRDSLGVVENFNQIMIERGFVPDNPGHVHFSVKAFMRDSLGLNSTLKSGPYRQPALVPSSPWLDDKPPQKPLFTSRIENDSLLVAWSHPEPADVFRWVVYTHTESGWNAHIYNRHDRQCRLALVDLIAGTENKPAEIAIAVSAVDRMGNESLRAHGTAALSPPSVD
ncbi:family 10 glycosylhydrolase [candidate division KSB1 bacterium]|nr:family 10 glycosylhydrolase [candidate division KSB1 bacterium]